MLSGFLLKRTTVGRSAAQRSWATVVASRAASTALARRPLFDKILIANRGEIACRIMRTAQKLAVKTVAVYSEADRNSMHVKMADEAYLIGPAPSAESYLRMEKIIEVAKASGAQAIHPGYGFLSENAGFAEAVSKAGLVFIGPPVKAIIDMGSKSASKIIMEEAQVPVVPGYHGEEQAVDYLKEQASRIGYPVLIKAIKGGGGKGMRIVEKQEDFELMLESAKREAIKSFGDDQVLIEKYIVRPRHVEVQVFADTQGNAVYLFERDCSVQRRHQKVLEEAPAPGLSPELRASLGEKAVAAAKAVNYVGAGTVEFILDTDTQQFYFMEMNTRLQVEHPVTEMVTNTDLVEWQLQVAAGNTLPKMQNALELDGHAFEARIYAENPMKDFLPDTGKLVHMRTPEPSQVVRVETGVREGDEVSVYYDPMISKLVVKGRDRTEALRVLRSALDQFHVVGPQTNISFLSALASHPAFIEADVETGFIKKHQADLLPSVAPATPKETIALAALGLIAREARQSTRTAKLSSDPFTPWITVPNLRLNQPSARKFTFKDGDKEITTADQPAQRLTGIRIHSSSEASADAEILVAEIQGKKISASVVNESRNGSVHVFAEGTKATIVLPPPAFLTGTAQSAGTGSVTTPMPCKISQVSVKAGDKVEKGQLLVVLEAMKMEHVIKAPQAGTVVKVHYKVNDLVAEGKQLVTIE
ncbi:carbamoyl-phosphate synthase L chain, ATP binding domain-containing protein [Gaertneriomyces semiglobifer]|nr:carbamoyl-phosphate synthase L chain, ATP binding domain-containing protein [Gaertneriomyces semiglobifer]